MATENVQAPDSLSNTAELARLQATTVISVDLICPVQFLLSASNLSKCLISQMTLWDDFVSMEGLRK